MNTFSKPARIAIYRFLDSEFFPRIAAVNHGYWKNLHQEIGGEFFNLTHKHIVVELALATSPSSTILGRKYAEKFEFLLLDGEEKILIKYLEFVLNYIYNARPIYDHFNVHIGIVLDKYNTGYKIIDRELVPLMGEEEAEEIEKALTGPYPNAKEHIGKAMRYFSNPDAPDYANSIKESISAVESIAKELTQEENAVLTDCIKAFKDNGIAMHPAFEGALIKLYGFTSDESGIRHGDSKESLQVNQATARFMLATCSAFVNYIIANTPDKK